MTPLDLFRTSMSGVVRIFVPAAGNTAAENIVAGDLAPPGAAPCLHLIVEFARSIAAASTRATSPPSCRPPPVTWTDVRRLVAR
ncbi:hypothetical protein ACFQX6_56160 [Streptosporangium lutulentum]